VNALENSPSLFHSHWWNRFRYTLWAPVYDVVIRQFYCRRQRAFELLKIKPGEKVLLAGAGTGLDLEYIPKDAEVTAVDFTPAMLARLHKRARRLGINVDVRQMDVQKMDFPDNTFDVVTLHMILAVVEDPVLCIREAARVLKPGGRATIFDKFIPDEGPAPLMPRLLNPILHVLASNGTRRLGPILKGSGFRIVHEEPADWGGWFKVILLRLDKPQEPTKH